MRGLAILLALLLAAPVAAAERLTGEQIKQAFTGNTVSGRYTGGGFFTEYHDQDGRALGHNGWQENRDACWITKGDAVCYYYGPPSDRTIHCFTVELSGQLYVLRTRREGRINGVATIEPGDPHQHADKMPPWHCDGLISQRRERERLAGR